MGAGLEVGAAGVADACVVEEAGGEGVGLVEDDLLAEDVGESGGSRGAEDGGGGGPGAFGEEGHGLLDLGVVGVAGEGAVALAEGSVNAEVELVLVVGVVGGAGVVVGGSGACWQWEALE